jgi:hypothetical protein
MRVFVLTAGRTGSTTFARAAEHITNYTATHESLSDRIDGRLAYPDYHIEVDNRLSWFLGSLERLYGDDPLYVHLTRDPEQTARSYAKRYDGPSSLMRAFGQGIVQRNAPPADEEDRVVLSRLCIDTINDNIEAFLRGRSKVVRAALPDLRPGFDEMWERIAAEGDLGAAHEDLERRHN